MPGTQEGGQFQGTEDVLFRTRRISRTAEWGWESVLGEGLEDDGRMGSEVSRETGRWEGGWGEAGWGAGGKGWGRWGGGVKGSRERRGWGGGAGAKLGGWSLLRRSPSGSLEAGSRLGYGM